MGNFNDNTCFLFADPNFITGMATAIDIGGTLVVYNQSRTPEEADYRATVSDWAAVAGDIKASVEKFQKEQKS